MEKKYIHTLIWLLAILWMVVLFLEGVMPISLALAFFKPISFIIATAILLIGVFDRWMWKWRVLRPWFVSVPNVSGTWSAMLDSSWINEATSENAKDIEAYFVIRQTLSTINIRMLTKESESKTISSTLVKDKNNGEYSIESTYLNEPKLLKVEKSPMHYGSLLCKVSNNRQQVSLSGCYWTSRKTTGEIKFLDRLPQQCSSFEECEKIYKH